MFEIGDKVTVLRLDDYFYAIPLSLNIEGFADKLAPIQVSIQELSATIVKEVPSEIALVIPRFPCDILYVIEDDWVARYSDKLIKVINGV